MSASIIDQISMRSGPLTAAIASPFDELLAELVRLAPKAFFVVLILLGGMLSAWLLGRITRFVVRKSGLEALAERAGISRPLYVVGARHGLAVLLGRVVFVACSILTLGLAAEYMGFPGFAAGIAVLLGFVPRILAAVFVLVGGIAIGALLKRVVSNLGQDSSVESPSAVGAVIYWVIVVVSVVLAADQAGLETGIVDALLMIGFGAAALALALGFAFASRHAFENVIALRYMSRVARPGDEVELDGVRGVVVRYAAGSVLLRADEQLISLPCTRFFAGATQIRDLSRETSPDPEAPGASST